MQKFCKNFTQGKKNIYTIFTHFAHFFANIFAQIFTQNLHNFYTLSLSSRGLKSLCKFEKCKIFTQGKKIFYTIFAHFAHILQKNLQKFLHIFLHNFYTPFCTKFAPFLQLHILQIFLHLRSREESVCTTAEIVSHSKKIPSSC